MNRPPLVLVSPNIETKDKEFGDRSTSLSETYQLALMAAGAIPLALPASVSRPVIAECLSRCDGVLLTGGEDVEPKIYANGLPPRLRQKVRVTPDGGQRDLRELLLIAEVLRQRKPLLGICRGHQMVNVALGGTLVVDIPSQLPEAIQHRRMDKRSQVVHEVRLTAGSLLAKITGRTTLGVNSTHHQAVARGCTSRRALESERGQPGRGHRGSGAETGQYRCAAVFVDCPVSSGASGGPFWRTPGDFPRIQPGLCAPSQ